MDSIYQTSQETVFSLFWTISCREINFDNVTTRLRENYIAWIHEFVSGLEYWIRSLHLFSCSRYTFPCWTRLYSKVSCTFLNTYCLNSHWSFCGTSTKISDAIIGRKNVTPFFWLEHCLTNATKGVTRPRNARQQNTMFEEVFQMLVPLSPMVTSYALRVHVTILTSVFCLRNLSKFTILHNQIV